MQNTSFNVKFKEILYRSIESVKKIMSNDKCLNLSYSIVWTILNWNKQTNWVLQFILMDYLIKDNHFLYVANSICPRKVSRPAVLHINDVIPLMSHLRNDGSSVGHCQQDEVPRGGVLAKTLDVDLCTLPVAWFRVNRPPYWYVDNCILPLIEYKIESELLPYIVVLWPD